jgi:hypothetical protein
MTVVPTENQREIVQIARDALPDDARPDVRPQNRWIVLSISESDDSIRGQDYREDVADRLRERGYKVSVVGENVKVTRSDLHWPDVQ